MLTVLSNKIMERKDLLHQRKGRLNIEREVLGVSLHSHVLVLNHDTDIVLFAEYVIPHLLFDIPCSTQIFEGV